MKELYNIGVVILSAGESSRMNTPKSFLKYDLNRRFIDKIIDEYKNIRINKIVVVVNKRDFDKLNLQDNISVCINEHLEYERFYSIKLGLEKIEDCDFCYIQNIDNPFVNDVILRNLYFKRNINGSTVPVYNERGGHPVLIGQDVINRIRKTNGSILNFKELLSEFPCNRIEIDDESILRNINSPEDYKKYFN